AENLTEEELSRIALALDGMQDVRVSLWQSEDGVCYFFLPGFARGRDLILHRAQGVRVQIGGREASQGDVICDITEGKPYEFILLGGEEEMLAETSVIFMYSADLPVFCISTLSGDMEAVHEDKEKEESGMAAVFDKTGAQVYSGRVESIRGRGNSTWGLSKKPYQFKFSGKTDLLGLGEGKAWNLLANGYDETKLRNQISLQLASALGMDYVPGGKTVDLYINDIYYGNYFLTQKIKVDSGSVDIRDMEKSAEDAYSREDMENIKSFQNEEGTRKWTEDVVRESDITGGYLFERELPDRFKDEISGFVTEQGDCYALKSPLYGSKEQVDYIADLMQEFQDAVEEEDGIHPVTGRHYSECIDIMSFAQKYLVEEISKNYDGGVTSSFFYKPQDTVSNKIFAGPVWDYDVAFGNCNLDEIACNPLGLTRLSDHVYGTSVFAKLYEKEDFYAQVTELYEKKAAPYLTGLLEGGIDEMVQGIRASVEMDSIRWENLENRYRYYENYDNSVRYLKYFVQQRMDFLNEVWLEGEVYHNVTFVVDGEQWQINCVKDGELPGSEPIPARNIGGSLFMGWVTEKGVPYDRFKPVYEDITFHAVWQELFTP
ncbi:MAG: CotH kinase family protein, partial [Lachnospiraceae bacterium]|nr:CotH kinase family protein [Lachnospiraceae bacterium]